MYEVSVCFLLLLHNITHSNYLIFLAILCQLKLLFSVNCFEYVCVCVKIYVSMSIYVWRIRGSRLMTSEMKAYK
jgi:hypothetical protein